MKIGCYNKALQETGGQRDFSEFSLAA